MIRAERVRSLPKTGWRNRLARHLYALHQRPAAGDFVDDQTRTRLELPVAGEWYVYWGGRTIAHNRHAVSRDQRFAYDFLILREGRSFHGPGDKNEEYFCFGRTVLAPADGLVASAGDELPDNSPGDKNAKTPLGNCVILDHGQGEFSFLAHCKHGSLRVRSRDSVQVGDSLGECGNSGHSSKPIFIIICRILPLRLRVMDCRRSWTTASPTANQ